MALQCQQCVDGECTVGKESGNSALTDSYVVLNDTNVGEIYELIDHILLHPCEDL